MSSIIDRTGELSRNNEGTLMKIMKYYNNKKILIEFIDKHHAQVICKYKDFKSGSVKNPYDKSIFEFGYMGVGEYNYRNDRRAYMTWYDMIKRCYSKDDNQHPTYKDCSVCEDWSCFQNFAEWYYSNYYEIKGENMNLDKDILIKNNKVYSPSTCVFTPKSINVLFTHKSNKRDNLPVGCFYNHGKIQVVCRTKYKQIIVGRYELNDIEGAFTAYKLFKEKHIKDVANEYKDLIPLKLYNAMINYEIDIDD